MHWMKFKWASSVNQGNGMIRCDICFVLRKTKTKTAMNKIKQSNRKLFLCFEQQFFLPILHLLFLGLKPFCPYTFTDLEPLDLYSGQVLQLWFDPEIPCCSASWTPGIDKKLLKVSVECASFSLAGPVASQPTESLYAVLEWRAACKTRNSLAAATLSTGSRTWCNTDISVSVARKIDLKEQLTLK